MGGPTAGHGSGGCAGGPGRGTPGRRPGGESRATAPASAGRPRSGVLLLARPGVEVGPPLDGGQMLSKTKRPYDPEELPPDKRLRKNLEDLYASNIISASRAQELVGAAAAAGSSDCAPLARRGGDSRHSCKRPQKAAREALPSGRTPTRPRSGCGTPRQSCEEEAGVSILLPHEVLSPTGQSGYQGCALWPGQPRPEDIGAPHFL